MALFTAGTSTHPIGFDIPAPALRSANNIAATHGISLDETAIRNVFNNATKAEFATKNQEFRNTESEFYRNQYAIDTGITDAIRRSNAAAAATGVSKATTQANALSAILTGQQQSGEAATELARQRNLLAAQEAEAYTQNTTNAMNEVNTRRQFAADQAMNLYAQDAIQQQTLASLFAAVDASSKGYETDRMAAMANYWLGMNQTQAANPNYGWQGMNNFNNWGFR